MYINGVKQGDTYRIENNSSFTPTDLADKVMGWVEQLIVMIVLLLVKEEEQSLLKL